MRFVPFGLIAALQLALLWQISALQNRAVQIEASLEFMDYGSAEAPACAMPLCQGNCGGEVIGLLDLP